MNLRVFPVDDLDLPFVPWAWPFAQARRAEIDAHFEERRARLPQLWNGRVLLLKECAVVDRRLAGACFETDFASFLAWRDWGFPDQEPTNCFAMGALRAADGGFLLGVMAAHTANAGLVYFPAGTPEPADIVNGGLDLAGSVTREIAEETGLKPDDYVAQPGWHAVPDGRRLALIKVLAATAPAATLLRRVNEHLARDERPELAEVRIARGPGDLDPMMPPFVRAFLAQAWHAGNG